LLTLNDVEADGDIRTYLEHAHIFLGEIGYTEHGFRHAGLVARRARDILRGLGYGERRAELAAVAGYLHDIGNVVSREGHELASVLLAHSRLAALGMEAGELSYVMSAIAGHEKGGEGMMNEVEAALCIADKSDVHRSRVRAPVPAGGAARMEDIHDRVNYSVTDSRLEVKGDSREVVLELTVDTTISPVMEYFEIFLERMMLSRESARFLGADFRLVINGTPLS
jgi:metal-dependent HD superfamily phosphatase/phosphodiesterase